MKKILSISSVFAITVGIILITCGIWGLYFTYQNVSRENITTPEDASIPGKKVRGPLTLKSQSDVIRYHTLKTTNEKTYSEMPRQIEKLDEEGQVVIGVDGKPLMITNTARDMWVTATTLITALNLGIVTYVFSGIVFLLGLISIWTGIVFCLLSRKYTQ